MFSKPRTSIWLPLCISLLLTCSLSSGKTEPKARKGKSITVTGCLKEGAMLDRFILTGQGGKAYGLRSTSVKMAEHVGHRVSIRGLLTRDPKRDEYDFEGSELNETYGKGVLDLVDVEVTSLRTVSPSCH